MKRDNTTTQTDTVSTQAERVRNAEAFVCCGQHAVCEKELLMKAASEPVEYFDDEELDRFIGRAADAYTAEEEDEFREVLYTTLTHEVGDWLKRFNGLK